MLKEAKTEETTEVAIYNLNNQSSLSSVLDTVTLLLNVYMPSQFTQYSPATNVYNIILYLSLIHI